MTTPSTTDKALIDDAVANERTRNNRLKRRDTLLGILTPIVLLILWELSARAGWIDVRVFTSPWGILTTGWEMIAQGQLFDHVTITLQRLGIGYVLGAAAGIFVGLFTGTIRPLRAALGPMFTALYALPMIALLPLLLLIFGLNEIPRILAIAITVFFVMQINTSAGMQQLDPTMLEAARAYQARGMKLFTTVLLPASIPSIATGLRVSAGLAVTVVTAVEFVASSQGLGFLIWNSWQLFQPASMYVGLICVAIIGAVFTGLLILVERLVSPWNRKK